MKEINLKKKKMKNYVITYISFNLLKMLGYFSVIAKHWESLSGLNSLNSLLVILQPNIA